MVQEYKFYNGRLCHRKGCFCLPESCLQKGGFQSIKKVTKEILQIFLNIEMANLNTLNVNTHSSSNSAGEAQFTDAKCRSLGFLPPRFCVLTLSWTLCSGVSVSSTFLQFSLTTASGRAFKGEELLRAVNPCCRKYITVQIKIRRGTWEILKSFFSTGHFSNKDAKKNSS